MAPSSARGRRDVVVIAGQNVASPSGAGCAGAVNGGGVGRSAARPAAATAISLPVAIPSVIGAAGIGATVIPDTAAGVAGGAVVGGVAIGAAGFVAVAGAGLGAGYAIGWAGVKSVGFAKANWFGAGGPGAAATSRNTFSNSQVTITYNSTTCAANDQCTIQFHVHFTVALAGSGGCPRYTLVGYSAGGVYTGAAVMLGPGGAGTDQDPVIFPAHVFGGPTNERVKNVQLQFESTGSCTPVNANLNSWDITAALPGWKLRTSWQCQAPDGTITAALSADSALFTSLASSPAEYPDAICGLPSHIVGVVHQVVAFNGATSGTVTPVDSWTPPARYTDPSDPLADCMAKAVAPCTVTYRNADGSPWTPKKNPSTGTVIPPATVDVGSHLGIAVPVTAPLPQTDPAGHPVIDPAVTPVTPDPAPSPLTTAPPVDPSHEPGPSGEPGSDASRCWPSGWGAFNPVEWVMKPTECALVWAFVPSASTWTETQTSIESAWSGSPVGSWISATVAIPASLAIPDAGSCEGPGFNFPIPGRSSVPMHPFAACDPPMSTLATAVRLIVSVGVLVGGAWLLVRQILSALGLQTATKTGEPS